MTDVDESQTQLWNEVVCPCSVLFRIHPQCNTLHKMPFSFYVDVHIERKVAFSFCVLYYYHRNMVIGVFYRTPKLLSGYRGVEQKR